MVSLLNKMGRTGQAQRTLGGGAGRLANWNGHRVQQWPNHRMPLSPMQGGLVANQRREFHAPFFFAGIFLVATNNVSVGCSFLILGVILEKKSPGNP